MSHYTPEGCLDVEDLSVGQTILGKWRETPELPGLQKVSRNDMADARTVREHYIEYFNGEGAVPWQNMSIGGVTIVLEVYIPGYILCCALSINVILIEICIHALVHRWKIKALFTFFCETSSKRISIS